MKNLHSKLLLREIAVKKSVIIFAVFIGLINVCVSIAIPALIGRAIDDRSESPLTSVALLTALVIISAASSYVLQRFAYNIAYETAASLRMKAERKLNSLSISKIDRTAKGDVLNTVSVDMEILSDGIIQGILQFIPGVLTVLGTIIIMLVINFRLALVVIIITPLSLLTAKLITGRSKREFASQSAIRAGLTAHADEWIGGQSVVKAFNMENESISKFSATNEKLRKVGFKAQLFSALVNPTTRFVNGLVYTFTGLVGLLLILNVIPGGATVTVGVLAAFLSYANQYTKPFNEISATYAELQNALSSAKRIFTLLGEPEEDNSEENAYIPMNDCLEVSHLDFSYNEDKKTLQDINFKLQKGENIAVVGPTGCGKTTLINLLERFYEPDSGQILSDGTDIKNYSKPSLRKNISMVLQDSFIFNDTIAANIRYGHPEATAGQAEEAARIIGAHSFIKRLPERYDTVITGNRELSTGQKQLISLSRVMLANMISPASLLILDEATSNIDTVTERKIKKAVKILTEGRTSIIIAHRLSTIKDSDMIIVIDGGKIVETGTHDSLITAGGVYENMYRA
ncbi:MAG: ABC transporter ATP-binding protein/permease [Ruminococcus sp.]|jgi:ATP-binding cassette subfamily B protein|nr:ABC transporter ATP-binding protein/permease [Ruminococcus sp.]